MATSAEPIHVLCVDDDPDTTDLVESHLGRHDGLAVSTVDGVEQALAVLADHGRAVDCVVSDYDVPGGDGIDLLRAVRERYGDLPFVLFTGTGSEAVAADAVQAGADSYVLKGGPDTYDLLAEQIRQQVTQHRAEQATERYETIVEALGDAVYVTDERGHFVYVNDAFAELTGHDREALLGEHPSLVKSADSLRAVEAELGRILGGDGPNSATAEIEIETRDGATVPCEDHVGVLPSGTGDYRGSVGTLRDMSERDRRERRLRRERNRARVLFEESPTPIARFHFEDGEPIVEAVNPAFEATFGYGEPEVVGESLDAFIVPPEYRSEAADVNRRVERGESVTVEMQRRTDGGARQFLLHAAAVETDRGREGYATYVDITEQQRREQELADRVRELEGFSDVMAHDLRNQLNIALGQLELARDDGDDEHLVAAQRALARTDELIGDLSEVMRSGSIVDETTDVDLAAVATTVWETIGADGDRLHVDDAGTVRADRQAVKRLLENLFRNSRQHGGDDVTVRVGTLPDGFYVADDGPGVPPADRSEVFVPGYSTAEDGTGFGLVSVRQIAAGHGWDVELADSEAGGLRVAFTDVETS